MPRSAHRFSLCNKLNNWTGRLPDYALSELKIDVENKKFSENDEIFFHAFRNYPPPPNLGAQKDYQTM